MQPFLYRPFALRVWEFLDAFLNFADSDDAQVYRVGIKSVDPGDDFWIRSPRNQFGDDVGIEQILHMRMSSRKPL